MPVEAKTFILAKDVIVTLTNTPFPTGFPDLASDTSVLDVVKIPAGGTVTVAQVKVPFTAALWADAAQPVNAQEILFNVATRQFRIKTAMINGDLLIVVVTPKGTVVRTS